MFKKLHHLASLSIHANDSNRNHDKTTHIKIGSLVLQPEIHEYQENSTSLCMEYILGKEQEGFFIFFPTGMSWFSISSGNVEVGEKN